MSKYVRLAAVLAALVLTAGCDQLRDLFGGGEDEAAGDAGAEATSVQPQGTQPPANQTQAGQTQTGQPQAGQEQPGADGGAGGQSAVCQRAARCCEIASNIQNFPNIYEQQREQACRTLHENTNLDDDGCRTVMGMVRQLYRLVNQDPPAECAAQ